jgi:hypothetical protein
MSANTRLWLVAAVIVISAGYAVLVKRDPGVAAAVAIVYIALLLTVFVLLNVWKKP